MGYRINSANDVAKAGAERVLAEGVWPEGGELFVFPDTRIGPDAGVTLWKGHRALNKGTDGPWTFPYEWDCCVLIDERFGDRADTFPLTFSWLFGHELCHAITALNDPVLFGTQLWVMYNIDRASGGQVQRWVDLGFERTCDQFGLGVALRFGSREDLLSEFDRLSEESIRHLDPVRVSRLQGLDPISEVPDQQEDLRSQIEPYRSSLIALLEEERERGEPSLLDQAALPRFLVRS